MTEYRERRRVLRIRIAGRPATKVRPAMDARLVDLSLAGARIEHFRPLHPEVPCTLELPAPSGPLVLPVRIVWSRAVGSEHTPEGKRRLRYQSGLEFIGVTQDQQASLARILDQQPPGR